MNILAILAMVSFRLRIGNNELFRLRDHRIVTLYALNV